LRSSLYSAAGSSDYLEAGPLKKTFLKVINEDLSFPAAAIQQPTLLIWGENDDTTPLKEARQLHDKIRGSKLVVLTGAGHFAYSEQPTKVAKLIEDFVK
jgi:pimeloyl-ACP methyl ester carboxylesterase